MNVESNSNGESSSLKILGTRSARGRHIFKARIVKQIYLQRFELGYLAWWDWQTKCEYSHKFSGSL
jgi:hypothetical protein